MIQYSRTGLKITVNSFTRDGSFFFNMSQMPFD